MTTSTMTTLRRTTTLALLACAAIASSGCAAERGDELDSSESAASAKDYGQKGKYPVEIREGGAYGRDMRVFVPQSPPPPGGFGALVFAHGFQLGVDDYDALLGYVASWGYVVFSVDYPQPFIGMDHRTARDAIVKVGRAISDGLVTGVPKIAKSRLAVGGHSLGGKLAVMAALVEPAFRAVVAFDPVDGAPGTPLGGEGKPTLPILANGSLGALEQPALFFGAERSHCARGILFFGGQACAPSNRDASTFFTASTASAARYELTLADFGHTDFLDDPVGGLTRDVCFHSKSPRGSRIAALHAATVAFLARHLHGETSAQSWLNGAEHAKLLASGVLLDPSDPDTACP